MTVCCLGLIRPHKGEAKASSDVQRCRVIRRAELRDLQRLQGIERAAGAAFRDLDMATIADDDPPALADLEI